MVDIKKLWSEGHLVVSDFLRSHELYIPWNSLGQNAGVGSLSLLQGIFSTQGSNPCLLYCSWILYQLSHKGSPRILEGVAYPFSSVSSWPRNWIRVSCIVGGFSTNWAIRETQEDHQENLKKKGCTYLVCITLMGLDISMHPWNHYQITATNLIHYLQKFSLTFLFIITIIVIRTQHKICTPSSFLSVQHSIVNCRHDPIQKLSRTYSSYVT